MKKKLEYQRDLDRSDRKSASQNSTSRKSANVCDPSIKNSWSFCRLLFRNRTRRMVSDLTTGTDVSEERRTGIYPSEPRTTHHCRLLLFRSYRESVSIDGDLSCVVEYILRSTSQFHTMTPPVQQKPTSVFPVETSYRWRGAHATTESKDGTGFHRPSLHDVCVEASLCCRVSFGRMWWLAKPVSVSVSSLYWPLSVSLSVLVRRRGRGRRRHRLWLAGGSALLGARPCDCFVSRLRHRSLSTLYRWHERGTFPPWDVLRERRRAAIRQRDPPWWWWWWWW